MTTKLLVGVTATLYLLMMVVTVGAADLTGGWKGTLASSDGSQAEVQVDFSPQGFPLYSYTNNKGVARQVELSHVGQMVEYVPRGGGVQRMVVKTFETGPCEPRLYGSAARSRPLRIYSRAGRFEHAGDDPIELSLRR